MLTVEEEDAALKEIYASMPDYEPTDDELQQTEDEFGVISGIIDHQLHEFTPDDKAGVVF